MAVALLLCTAHLLIAFFYPYSQCEYRRCVWQMGRARGLALPRPKKRKPEPLATLPSEGVEGGAEPQTHWWVAPELENEPPQLPIPMQVEAEPEQLLDSQPMAWQPAEDVDKAVADLKDAQTAFDRTFVVLSDIELASSWGAQALAARFKERAEAAKTKLQHAQTAYFAAAIAADTLSAAERRVFLAQSAVQMKQMDIMCAQCMLSALLVAERDELMSRCE